MSKNADWATTPNLRRKRRMVTITLGEVARARLDQAAEERGVSRSALVEALIMAIRDSTILDTT